MKSFKGKYKVIKSGSLNKHINASIAYSAPEKRRLETTIVNSINACDKLKPDEIKLLLTCLVTPNILTPTTLGKEFSSLFGKLKIEINEFIFICSSDHNFTAVSNSCYA